MRGQFIYGLRRGLAWVFNLSVISSVISCGKPTEDLVIQSILGDSISTGDASPKCSPASGAAVVSPQPPDLWDYQWAFNNTGQTMVPSTKPYRTYYSSGSPHLIGVTSANINHLDRTTPSDCRGVAVAVIDTGVTFDHSDLKTNDFINPSEASEGRETNCKDDDQNGYLDDYRGWDFVSKDNNPTDDNGHGTHVSGIIAANRDTKGVAGVCGVARIVPLKTMDDQGSGALSDILEAFAYAQKPSLNIKLINMSVGFSGLNETSPEFKSLQTAICGSTNSLIKKGIIVVVAAGNDGVSNDTKTDGTHSVSANSLSRLGCDNVVSVAATTNQDKLAGFSNFGSVTTAIAAPGQSILSSYFPAQTTDTPPKLIDFVFLDGTSMATPFVTGALALGWSVRKDLAWYDLKALLLSSSASDVLSSLDGKVQGKYRLNIGKFLAEVKK
jgi:subtilisin family serine protease